MAWSCLLVGSPVCLQGPSSHWEHQWGLWGECQWWCEVVPLPPSNHAHLCCSCTPSLGWNVKPYHAAAACSCESATSLMPQRWWIAPGYTLQTKWSSIGMLATQKKKHLQIPGPDEREKPRPFSSMYRTCVGIVIFVHPQGNGEELEDIEGVEYLFYKQDMVWLHRNINGVRTIQTQPAHTREYISHTILQGSTSAILHYFVGA